MQICGFLGFQMLQLTRSLSLSFSLSLSLLALALAGSLEASRGGLDNSSGACLRLAPFSLHVGPRSGRWAPLLSPATER